MGAILSKQALEQNARWPPPAPGGNSLSHSLDRYNDNWNMISLTFVTHTPMAYRKKPAAHLCFMAVDVSVAARPGVVFTDSNAAGTGGQQRGTGLAGLALVDFAAFRADPRPWDRPGWVRPVQAEVLVPGRIALDSIREIGFLSTASIEEAKRLWGAAPAPAFSLRPEFFSNVPRSVSIGFPYLQDIFLTDALVDETTVAGALEARVRFSRRKSARISAVASVAASPGLKAHATWGPIGLSQATEFERSGDFWHWPSIEIGDLPDGPCTMEYRLGNVRWATLRFEVIR